MGTAVALMLGGVTLTSILSHYGRRGKREANRSYENILGSLFPYATRFFVGEPPQTYIWVEEEEGLHHAGDYFVGLLPGDSERAEPEGAAFPQNRLLTIESWSLSLEE